MILEIKSANASWENNNLYVSFSVIPVEGAHLDLQTGEIFQRDDYAVMRGQEDRVIGATLFVTGPQQNCDGADLPNEMKYHHASDEIDAEIWIQLRLAQDELAGFHALLMAGKTPLQAVVFFPFGEFEYGWEPDGSGQKWNNESKPSIPIERISFRFDFRVESANQPWTKEGLEHVERALVGVDRAFFSDTARVNFAVLLKLQAVESSLRQIFWSVGLIALSIWGLELYRILR